FIVEYIAQTRGWFYTMHVLSGALFDRPAFRNVICHGVVLDAEGRKLSKKLRNYPDPEEVFESHGSDALRWYLMASPILRGGDLRVAADASDVTDVVRLVINPIWNAYAFFTMYANADGVRAEYRTDASGLLDRYILATTHELVADVTRRMDAYDIAGSCAQVQSYLDALNNWYVRRSRERFWGTGTDGSAQDRKDAFDTLFTVLTVLTKVVAPLLPFVAEEIYLGLHGGADGDTSVHLADWPDADDLPADPVLVAQMDLVREVCSVALGLREDHRLRARLPLARLTVAGTGLEALGPLLHLVTDEVNVKEVTLTDDMASVGELVLRPDPKVLGPRLGKAVQAVLAAARNGEWVRADDGTVTLAGAEIRPDEYELALQPRDGAAAAPLRQHDGVVELDVEVTPGLAAEGMARDVVRLLQQARKDAGLVVTDRITATLDADPQVLDAVRTHQTWVAEQVLAVSLELGTTDGGEPQGTVDGHPVRVTVNRTDPATGA
ncbi:MAG: DUF5915 domain-containing protein, partial [Actinomycetes bacterium]